MPDSKWLKLTGWTCLVTTLICVSVSAQSPDTKETPKAPPAKPDSKSAPDAKPSSSNPSAPAATKPGTAEAKKPADAAKADVPATFKPPEVNLAESYRDPRVDDAMNADLIKELPTPKPVFSQNEEKQVIAIAGGRGDLVTRSINRFVEAKAADLTNKKAIETLISGEGTVNTLVRPIETATKQLIRASRDSNAAANSPFMSAYVATLIRVLQPQLKAHLVTRVQVAQVFAATGSVDVIPILVSIIGDETQPWQVKMIALEGINNVIQGGKRSLGFSQRTQLTVAVQNMLREEKNPPWFLESLASKLIGNLRIVSELVSERKVEPAETLLGFLIDPAEHAEVRFEAARSLGLLDIPNQFRPFNYLLVATSVADAVAQTGTQVAAMTPTDSSRAQQLVAIMADKVSPSFLGIQGILDSGILRQAEVGKAEAETRKAIDTLFAKIKDVVNTASNFTRARGELVQARRTDLQSQVVELKKLVDKYQPKDRTLVKGGKAFEIKGAAAPAQVAQGLSSL
ncbi:MAG: hypothetical protein NT172_18305 [Planctomycetota bacterium]|nr:hypothetical protein [Planctomycetota bacterium]